jgi:ferric-dicitrate binding protein FerR (iron transport regulator)
MTDKPQANGASQAPDVTEQNLERLLGKAYKPEAPDPDFAQRVRDRLAAAARDSSFRESMNRRRSVFGRRFLSALAAAAALAGLALLFNYLATPAVTVQPFAQKDQPPDDDQPPPRKKLPASEQTPAEQNIDAQTVQRQYADHLTPRPRPQAPETPKLAVGESLATKAGERQRVALPDGSVLYLNEKTTAKLDADRHVTLSAGEVFVEVAPKPDGARFVVKTREREVVAVGTKFDVAAFAAGTGVTVTQGKVKVSGLDDVLTAGQQLAPDAKQPATAPRAAAALAWTRELMCAAEAPLVPPSKYAGGAVVVNDPTGRQAQLSLRKYHVDVHVEDGFARTTIDQTYFNSEMRRLEGTFYFPLPADASLSRLAMYVNGQLMEGGMAERDFARRTFDNIVRRMQDPALLEWVDGTTYKMRVFPLEPRQEKRIVLSYTQRLPAQYGRTTYRFPAGHSLEAVRDWSFHALVKNGKSLTWASDTHGESLRARTEKNDLLLDASEKNVTQFRDVALDLYDGGKQPRGDESARFSSADHDNARYFMVRYRPELPTAKERRHRDWVFLFESSGDRDPLLARTQIEVVRTMLNNAEHDDTFAIVTAATRAGTFAKEAKPVTGENVAEAIRYLEETHLAGALDLGAALDAAGPFLKSAENPYLVHLGSGLPVLGETKADVLAKRVPENTHYVGVGVGKRWNRALMKQAAERSSGFFTQINPDEPINWRAFELHSALTAPRLLDVKVVDNAEKATFLTHTSAVAQGEEVCAITRLPAGATMPQAVTVTGILDGKTFTRSVPVKTVAHGADYLPRTWARLEIDRLLAAGAQPNKATIVQLSMASYVMTPFTSLLVLENEQMYQQYGVDRGRKDHWAMYPCPQTIPVVQEWPNGAPAPKAEPAAKPMAEDVLATILVRVPPRAFADGAAANLPRAVTVRDLVLGAYGVPMFEVMDKSGKDSPFSFWMGVEGRPADPKAADLPPPMVTPPVPGNVKLPPYPPTEGPPPPPSLPPVTAPVSPTGGPVPVSGGGGAMAPDGFGLGGGFNPGGGGFNLGGGIGGMMGAQGFGNRFAVTAGGFPGSGRVTNGTSASAAGRGGPGGPGGSTYAPSFATPYQQWGGSGPNPYLYYSGVPGYAGYLPPGLIQASAGDVKAGLKDKGVGKNDPRLDFGFKEAGQKRFDDDRYDEKSALRRQRDEVDRLKLLLAEESRRGFTEDKKMVEDEGGGLLDLEQKLAVLRDRAARVAAPGVPAATYRPDGLLYRQPSFAPDGRTFSDLVAYAPGLNTSTADVLGVLEAEAASDTADAPGKVDPAARALIEAARASGWRTLTVPAAGGAAAWSVAFDGSGRYAVERVLSSGLKEQVVCDGKELLHLYPELGLGARRTVTRFHRAELADLVPWALPPAKDLAHGRDLKAVGEHTVALLPRGLKADHPAIVVHLVFGEDGRLEERRLVELPKEKVLRRETYATDGTVKVIDGDGKELSSRKLAVKVGGAPDLLDVDTKELVVLPMPLRTREHIIQQPGAAGGDFNSMDRAWLLALIGADSATGNAALVQNAVQVRAWNLSDNRPGFLALLLSAGYDLNALPVPDSAAKSSLARYIISVRQSATIDKADLGDGLLRRLIDVQSLVRAWQSGAAITDAGAAQAVKVIREAKSPLFVWAVVVEALRVPDHQVMVKGGRAKLQRDVLEAACATLKDVPGLSYAARYELARHLADNGDRAEARKQFAELYRDTAKAGTLPPLDRGFRQAMQVSGKEPDLFADLLRETADQWVKKDRREAVVALAWQAWELESPAQADDLLSRALGGTADPDKAASPTLFAVEYLAQTHQYDRADKLLQGLLADKKLADHPGLWRTGYQLAMQRKQPSRAYACLAQALELEYRAMPEWIDVAAVRQDYGALLGYYAEVVRATTTLGQKPPADLAAKVVRAADRWRCLDVDGMAACAVAFQSLRGLGDADAAWDYLLMSSGAEQEGFQWVNLAQSLQQQEDFDLAERAYKQACLLAPANAELMRLRADNLLRAGHAAEGREVLRQIGEVSAPAPTLPPAPVKPEDRKP